MIQTAAVMIAVALLATAASSPTSPPPPQLPAEERFDGGFRLDNGAIITGGKFVEGEAGLWIYLDTGNTAFGSAFARVGESSTFRSLSPPGSTSDRKIELEFRQGAGGVFDRVVWREDGKAVEGRRVFAHSSREIAIPSFDGTVLKGRLIEPVCTGPRPAVVAVHGSGPATRFGGPFDLFFVRQGMAVLTYDKRGKAAGSRWSEPDIGDLAEDAAAAARFLSAQSGIDPARIGLIGSSQGGWTAPISASLSDEVDFLILRAGAATRQHDTYVHEKRQEWRADGLHGLDLDNAVALLDQVLAVAEGGRPIEDADRIAAPFVGTGWYEKAFGRGKLSDNWSASWWGYVARNMRATSLPAVEHSRLPTLWFLADRDEAVPYVSTRAALESAFATSPSKDETIVVVPGAPHIFIVEREGKPGYAPEFFSTMESWLKARNLSEPGCWKA